MLTEIAFYLIEQLNIKILIKMKPVAFKGKYTTRSKITLNSTTGHISHFNY
jgi:hypothetical protein